MVGGTKEAAGVWNVPSQKVVTGAPRGPGCNCTGRAMPDVIRSKAVVMASPGVVSVEDVEVKRSEADGPSLIAGVLEVSLSGICGTDVHTWRGEALQYAGTPDERELRYPITCGHENVGVLEEVTPALSAAWDGTPLHPGQRVVVAANVPCGRCRTCRMHRPYYLCEAMENYGNSLGHWRYPHLLGGWAERMCLLPGSALFCVPDDLPDDVAVLTEPLAVTHGLDRARAVLELDDGPGANGSIVIVGAGALGLCHLVRARGDGLGPTVVVERSSARAAFAASVGADVVVEGTGGAEGDDEIVGAVADATRGGADIVVNCSGTGATLPLAMRCARPGGVVIEVGAYVGTTPVSLNPNSDLCARGLTLLGIGGETLESYLPTIRRLRSWQGWIRSSGLVSRRIGLDDVGETLDGLAAGAIAGQVVVDPRIR
jgi:threonine dehydrogenase-like Zn-dependent dehydrogenase